MDQNAAAGQTPALYTIGTLSYTKRALIMLFVWMLWGDFCFWMMEALTPTLLPLMLKNHNANNLTIGLLVGSLPSLLNFIINPIVSTSSDRTRSRWGRRIPYLLFSSPFVVFFLILLGWSDSIGAWIHNLAFGPGGSPAKTIIVVIAIFAIAYQVFNLFIASVFYYLFADVVPTQFLGRFMALFRVAGTCAGFVFNLLVLPHADTHLPWIFTIVALVYLVSFLLMCFHVREGEYPPPEPVRNRSPFGFVSVYVKECFSIPFFLVYFLVMALNNASTVCRSMFNLLFATKELHISLEQYGFIIAVGSGITIPLFYFVGLLVDRIHPIRVYMIGSVLIICMNIFGFFWVHSYATFSVVAISLAFVYMLQIASTLPLNMRLVPRDKYGQFSSAMAMVSAITLVLANAGGGWFIDLLGYQYIYMWDFLFTTVGLILLIWVYRKWKALGGDKNYVPPERSPDLDGGAEGKTELSA